MHLKLIGGQYQGPSSKILRTEWKIRVRVPDIGHHSGCIMGYALTVFWQNLTGRNNFANRAVVYILDSVIPELVKNPDRRFIYVEIAFFWRWWNQQNDEMKSTVKQLVNEGKDTCAYMNMVDLSQGFLSMGGNFVWNVGREH